MMTPAPPAPAPGCSEVVDRTGNWQKIASKFARKEVQPAEFPRSLAPISVAPLDPTSGFGKLPFEHGDFEWTVGVPRAAPAVLG